MNEYRRFWLYPVSVEHNTVIGYKKEPRHVDNTVPVIELRAYEDSLEEIKKLKDKKDEWPIDRHGDI